jgi:hypothetical protein
MSPAGGGAGLRSLALHGNRSGRGIVHNEY